MVGTYLVELITVVQPNESLITYTCKNVYHGTSNFDPPVSMFLKYMYVECSIVHVMYVMYVMCTVCMYVCVYICMYVYVLCMSRLY